MVTAAFRDLDSMTDPRARCLLFICANVLKDIAQSVDGEPVSGDQWVGLKTVFKEIERVVDCLDSADFSVSWKLCQDVCLAHKPVNTIH